MPPMLPPSDAQEKDGTKKMEFHEILSVSCRYDWWSWR